VLREKDKERLYSIADPNWNVVAIIDSAGDVKERYTYDAFGKRNVFDTNFVAKTETSFDWNRAFTGQVLDVETGLMLYRNRYYHTGLGRFVSRDALRYRAEDVNLYRLTKNSPISSNDTFGFVGSSSTEYKPSGKVPKFELIFNDEFPHESYVAYCNDAAKTDPEAAGVIYCCEGRAVPCINKGAISASSPYIKNVIAACAARHE
jgi:RHS repeat-associated protein